MDESMDDFYFGNDPCDDISGPLLSEWIETKNKSNSTTDKLNQKS